MYCQDIKRKEKDTLRGIKNILDFLRSRLETEKTIFEMCSSVDTLRLLGERTTGYVDKRLCKTQPETARKDLVAFNKLLKFLKQENSSEKIVNQEDLEIGHNVVKEICRSLKPDQKRYIQYSYGMGNLLFFLMQWVTNLFITWLAYFCGKSNKLCLCLIGGSKK